MIGKKVLCTVSAALSVALLSGCATRPDSFTYATHVSRITFTAVDVETTGLDAKNARIVEIGAIKLRNGVTLQQRTWLINPGIPIPASAVKVHGISSDMVSNSPAFAGVMPEFEKFVEGTVLLAHNARFDTGFFKAELVRTGGQAPPNIVLDTLPLCRQWFPDALRHSLQYLSEYFDIVSEQPHRALDDAATLRSVFNRGMRTESQRMTFGDLVKKAGGEYRLGGTMAVAGNEGAQD